MMTFSLTPLLALFTHPLMLGWLAAAAAPLIIHLLNKRKHREVTWAAMQYLLAAMRKNSRRIVVEQWILLAVRTLLIVMLILAVAEPFLEQAGRMFAAGQRTHKVFVIDGSLSMAYKPSDASHFERAKELAIEIVEASHQGDACSLVLMSDPPRVVVGTPAIDRRSFINEIQSLQLPHGGADLPATLAKVEELLESARREQPGLVQEEIFFISDLGRNTWMPELPGTEAVDEFVERSARLGEAARLMVIDLGQEDCDNLLITDLRIAEAYVTVSRDVTFEVGIRNFGRQGRARQRIELFVDGRRAGEQFVDVEAGGQASVAFLYRFDTPGDHAVEARLAPDLLDLDNHRWLAVPAKERLRVLCVDGERGGGRLGGAAGYLAVALAPETPSAGNSEVDVEVAAESVLLERDLESYDGLFLTNIGQFTQGEARVLREYLDQGGGLVVFLGDQVIVDSYNRQLAAEVDPSRRVLAARLVDVAPEGSYFFNPLEYRHPLVQAFRAQESAGLLTTHVSRYVRIEGFDDGSTQVALAFDNNDPAIVEQPIGRGHSILVATSADAEWTTWPMWPSYVPLVQEMLAWAVRGQATDHNRLVGEPIVASARAAGLAMRLPTDELVPIRAAADGSRGWSFDDTYTSGIYAAQSESQGSLAAMYAVNVDTGLGDRDAESHLVKVDEAELAETSWSGVRFDYRTTWQDARQRSAEEIVRRSTLHQGFLFGALVLLLTETVLAWWFGRQIT